MITRGQMALETNQRGYDVISAENERISVKTVTSSVHVSFNQNTFDLVDRVMVLRVNVDEEDGVSVETLLDCSAQEFLEKYGKSNGKHVFGAQGEKRPLKSLDNLTISNEATFGDYLVRQYENGTIQVSKSDELQQMAKPHLREIAAEIGVDLLNSNSKAKNTRQLGADIIKVLQVKSGG